MQIAVTIGCAIALPISMYLMCKGASDVKLYGVGEEIQNGTTGFTATKVRAVDRIGTLRAPANKLFYVVTVRATNHAAEALKTFHPNIAKFYTLEGQAEPQSPEGQAAYDKSINAAQLDPTTLGPGGDTVSRDVVFVGRADLTSARLGFSANGPFGDLLEDLVGGNVNILLPIQQPQFLTR